MKQELHMIPNVYTAIQLIALLTRSDWQKFTEYESSMFQILARIANTNICISKASSSRHNYRTLLPHNFLPLWIYDTGAGSRLQTQLNLYG